MSEIISVLEMVLVLQKNFSFLVGCLANSFFGVICFPDFAFAFSFRIQTEAKTVI